jgi:RNA polymerase sigma factor (sigma-70 family)
LVYSVALRLVRSQPIAEEVAQSVFTDLARNADKLRADTILSAWLYRVAYRTAVDVVRKESRRQNREQKAVEMAAMNSESSEWTHIEPLLDEGVQALDETDRAAVLLRYFENKSLREVGQQLSVSDDAAQKRVSRAVERLREFFAKRGVAVGAGGLVVVISANAVQAAPVGLAATISSAAVLAGTTIAATATATITKAIAMTALQKTLITTAIVVTATTGIYEARQASRLRDQVQTLQQRQEPLTAQIQQLQRERDEAANRLTMLAGEMAEAKNTSTELLKLRGQVTRLEQDSKELARLKANDTNAAANKYPGPRWKGFLEQEALDTLARLKRITTLTPDQEQTIRDLLLKQADLHTQAMQEEFDNTQTQESKNQFSQSYSNLNAQMEALLSPDQEAALEASRQRGRELFARMNADSEVYMLQISVGMNPEQEDQIFPILYGFALREREGTSTDPTEKANALATVLTPSQMEQYRKSMQNRNIRAVIQAGQAK